MGEAEELGLTGLSDIFCKLHPFNKAVKPGGALFNKFMSPDKTAAGEYAGDFNKLESNEYCVVMQVTTVG